MSKISIFERIKPTGRTKLSYNGKEPAPNKINKAFEEATEQIDTNMKKPKGDDHLGNLIDTEV